MELIGDFLDLQIHYLQKESKLRIQDEFWCGETRAKRTNPHTGKIAAIILPKKLCFLHHNLGGFFCSVHKPTKRAN